MRLVGTDLVQAVPLVLAAAISNIALNGLDWRILIPLVIGSVPGHASSAAEIAPRVPQSFIRRGIVIVLTMSGLALLDKAGWAPLGAGEDDTHPVFIALVGLAMIVVVPARLGPDPRTRSRALPMFGVAHASADRGRLGTTGATPRRDGRRDAAADGQLSRSRRPESMSRPQTHRPHSTTRRWSAPRPPTSPSSHDSGCAVTPS